MFGYEAHKKSVDIMCFFLVISTYLLFTRYKINNLKILPTGVPLIFAANHQSMYDTTSLAWFLRKTHPKFIGKIELSKGLFGISYSMTHGGSVLIDRKNPRQSLSAIQGLAQYIEISKRSAIIFPEGTRSKTTSKPNQFAENGLKILCKYAPSAYVVPITINNSWKMTRWGSFPLGIGNKLIFTIHDPIPVKDVPFNEIFEKTEQSIIRAILPVE
jgi:1-acyl-sn-glycerol-3-phosphate acyltransferase